ncbi:hypothetical protein RCL_jg10380.t1 [Rhizophagus clarus]|uniref:Uncharacterized protein n=1 Tax=Rhizophagus clarus TaxID=94130 RepID=A0A8H3KVN3_9GLOM|nr:hypothetical protein RCL_jg10380.t1 [Rhizophagus clarus]
MVRQLTLVFFRPEESPEEAWPKTCINWKFMIFPRIFLPSYYFTIKSHISLQVITEGFAIPSFLISLRNYQNFSGSRSCLDMG